MMRIRVTDLCGREPAVEVDECDLDDYVRDTLDVLLTEDNLTGPWFIGERQYEAVAA
jgi:hypothetical protein